MKRATILLSVGLLLVPMSLAAEGHKQKEWEATPLVPIQETPLQHITPPGNVSSMTTIHITANGSTEKIPLKVVVLVNAKRSVQVIGKADEIWLLVVYAARVIGQKPDLALPDYVVDTTGIEVTDGEGVKLERVSLASRVNEMLEGVNPITVPQGYRELIREPLAFYQDHYLRDRLTFLGSDLVRTEPKTQPGTVIHRRAGELKPGASSVQPKPKVRSGFVFYRRADGLKPVGPITVEVPVPDPTGDFGFWPSLAFRFVDAP